MNLIEHIVTQERAMEYDAAQRARGCEKEEMPTPCGVSHNPVMLQEVVEYLNLKEGATIVDATLGLGGHAQAILGRLGKSGRLIGIDKDAASLEAAQNRLRKFLKNCLFVRDDFRNLDRIFEKYGLAAADGILFDLGVSSFQIDDPERGLSFRTDGPLDMRLDRESFVTAYDLLNNLTEEEISSILWKFGEERFARRIARGIIEARRRAPLASTTQLAQVVAGALPAGLRRARIHPATRTFQALRIAVNRELDAFEAGLKKATALLNKGGRICVLTFHSLEDRIAKENFRRCAKEGGFRLVFKKVLRPGAEELAMNPRSRSAKMRVLERIS